MHLGLNDYQVRFPGNPQPLSWFFNLYKNRCPGFAVRDIRLEMKRRINCANSMPARVKARPETFWPFWRKGAIDERTGEVTQ